MLTIGLDGLEKLEIPSQETVVMTDGWTDGPLAAVLRGGINAQAVLSWPCSTRRGSRT